MKSSCRLGFHEDTRKAGDSERETERIMCGSRRGETDSTVSTVLRSYSCSHTPRRVLEVFCLCFVCDLKQFRADANILTTGARPDAHGGSRGLDAAPVPLNRA